MPTKRNVILYSRDGCHLCEQAEKTLANLHLNADFISEVIKIDSDPVLVAQFSHEIPVVFIDGRKAFKFQIDEKQFLRWM